MRSRNRRLGSRWAAVAVSAAVLTAGCSAQEVKRGWMPGEPGITDHTDLVTNLWTGSWIAALFVGGVTWGLILWCVAAYRRRSTDTGFPEQLRYHVPLEIMYTVIPFMMVSVLFFYTARDQSEIEARLPNPDVTVEVIGKQWSWDFNYPDSNVHEAGIQAPLGTAQAEENLPTLYLPVNKRVEMVIHSRDVIHSVWVPAFLYKKDAIPGRSNYYQFTPQKTGTFAGKCAELCGEYHSEMLFNVKVVDQAEYDKHMADLRAKGQSGLLPINLGRMKTIVEDEDRIGGEQGGLTSGSGQNNG
jgi:cytochrome c oxidase subunit 2